MEKISVVLPCYNSAPFIEELALRLKNIILKMGFEYELIFVVDQSPQNDWQLVKKICTKDTKIKGILFSRNFGQHAALYAGIEHTTGDYTVMMDADLQDNPDTIPILFEKLQSGYEVVFAKRIDRQHTKFKIFLSKAFHTTFRLLSKFELHSDVANFSIFTQKVRVLYYQSATKKNVFLS